MYKYTYSKKKHSILQIFILCGSCLNTIVNKDIKDFLLYLDSDFDTKLYKEQDKSTEKNENNVKKENTHKKKDKVPKKKKIVKKENTNKSTTDDTVKKEQPIADQSQEKNDQVKDPDLQDNKIADQSQEKNDQVKDLDLQDNKITDQSQEKNDQIENLDLLETQIVKSFSIPDLQNGISTGMVILYKYISNLVVHPFLILLFVLQLIIVIVISISIFVKIKSNKSHEQSFFAFVFIGTIHFILLIDLICIIYESITITSIFLVYTRDIIFLFTSSFVGFLVGKYFTMFTVSTKKIP